MSPPVESPYVTQGLLEQGLVWWPGVVAWRSFAAVLRCASGFSSRLPPRTLGRCCCGGFWLFWAFVLEFFPSLAAQSGLCSWSAALVECCFVSPVRLRAVVGPVGSPPLGESLSVNLHPSYLEALPGGGCYGVAYPCS